MARLTDEQNPDMVEPERRAQGSSASAMMRREPKEITMDQQRTMGLVMALVLGVAMPGAFAAEKKGSKDTASSSTQQTTSSSSEKPQPRWKEGKMEGRVIKTGSDSHGRWAKFTNPNDETTAFFYLDATTAITKDGQPAKWEDLVVGTYIVVTFPRVQPDENRQKASVFEIISNPSSLKAASTSASSAPSPAASATAPKDTGEKDKEEKTQ